MVNVYCTALTTLDLVYPRDSPIFRLQTIIDFHNDHWVADATSRVFDTFLPNGERLLYSFDDIGLDLSLLFSYLPATDYYRFSQ